MPLTNSLLATLSGNHPDLTFTAGDRFSWDPNTKTVTFTDEEPHGDSLLLHEASHALLGHTDYTRDVELLAMERAAWDTAVEIAQTTNPVVEIEEEFIEEHLDTYREWLHARSTCPSCTATGYQTGALAYKCAACNENWRVNEARLCELRRYRK